MADQIEFAKLPLIELEEIYTTLLAVENYLTARDVAKSQLLMLDEPRYNQLTTDVQKRTQRVKHIVNDHIVEKYHAERAVAEAPEEAPDFVEPDGADAEPLPEAMPFKGTKAPPLPLGDAHIIEAGESD